LGKQKHNWAEALQRFRVFGLKEREGDYGRLEHQKLENFRREEGDLSPLRNRKGKGGGRNQWKREKRKSFEGKKIHEGGSHARTVCYSNHR